MVDVKLTQFKILCFDVYGTLVDWETGIFRGIESLITRSDKSWNRNQALQAYTSVEKNLQGGNPSALYTEILAETYYTLAKRLELPETQELKEQSAAFGNSIPSWPVFSDTISALERLSKHYRLVVLSNVDRESFAQTRKVLEQGFTFDLIITAQDVGSYKPNVANFEHMLATAKEQLGAEKHEVLVTAQSLYHDHQPANSLGIATSWIAREDAVMGVEVDVPHIFEFPTLGAMANAVEMEEAR